jgi:hypothetical protein
MTEAEWLAESDPYGMLECVRDRATPRQYRLFSVVCCRRVLHLGDDSSAALVALAERCADGSVSNSMLAGIPPPDYGNAQHVQNAARSAAAIDGDCVSHSQEAAISAAMAAGAHAYQRRSWDDGLATNDYMEAKLGEEAAQARLLRDIVGNPFRPAAVDPSWCTSTVVALARGIYEERAFDRLPILADALQDAGCDSADVLDHCRGPGPHVRGCWVVDLLLGKE